MSQKQKSDRRSRQSTSLLEMAVPGDESVVHAEDEQIMAETVDKAKKQRRRSSKKKLELPALSQLSSQEEEGESEELQEFEEQEEEQEEQRGEAMEEQEEEEVVGERKKPSKRKQTRKQRAELEEEEEEADFSEEEMEQYAEYDEEQEEEEEEMDESHLETAASRLSTLERALGGRKFTKAEFETAMLGASTKNCIPGATMKRILKDIIQDVFPGGLMTKSAFDMLCAAAEEALTNAFFVGNILSRIRDTMTVKEGDLKLASLITGMANKGRGLDMHTSELGNVLRAYGHKVHELPPMYMPSASEASNTSFPPEHFAQQDLAIVGIERQKQREWRQRKAMASKEKEEEPKEKEKKKRKRKSSVESEKEDAADDNKKPKKKARNPKNKEKHSKKSTGPSTKSKNK